jgi:hypothetical protein
MIYPDLPVKALSIRQPWAWAIIHAGKDIENRPRRAHFRGRICIHASQHYNERDYQETRKWMLENGLPAPSFPFPAKNYMDLGGIVGTVEIVGCIDRNEHAVMSQKGTSSPWFFGPFGYVLRDPQPCELIPVKGMLGLFDWRKNLL